MAKKEFIYTIKVDDNGVEKTITKTAKSLNDYEEGIKGLQDQLNATDLGSKKYKKLQKELKGAEKQFEKAKLKSQSFGDSMSAIPGPIGQVSQGVKGVSAAMKVLAANPIILALTLIVAALTAVYKAFTSTKEGAEKLH